MDIPKLNPKFDQDIPLNLVLQKAIELTKKFEEINKYNVPPKDNMSPKALKVKAIIESEIGSIYGTPWALFLGKLMSEILEEEIEIQGEERIVTHIPGAIIVPLKRENGHDYPIGRPCMLSSSDRHAIKEDGDEGNRLGFGFSHLRPATEDEIKEFISHVPQAVTCLINL